MLRFRYLILLCLIATVGCSGHLKPHPPAPPTSIEDKQFALVTVGPDDTLTTLAQTHLNDAGKAWQIAAYNRIETLTPGQRVVIPKISLNRGGISQKGYQTVPVLLYQKISHRPAKSKAVHAKAFEGQLKHLNDNGFVTVSLAQFDAFLSFKDPLPPKAVVISFDTTQNWAYDITFPLIKRYKMKAALFIQLKEIGGKGRLTWSQIAEMAEHGIDIGIHGVISEPSKKDDLKHYLERFEKSFSAPKRAFKSRLKIPCRYFSYAQGESDDYAIAMLKKHGYRMAFTRKRGSSPFFIDNYKIKRSLIHGHYDLSQFIQNLTTFKPAELK